MTTAKAYDGGPLRVGAIALSPGRVTWSDNSIKGGGIWTRVLTKTAGGFTAGPVHQLGVGMPTVISASGSRTAWITPDGSGTVTLRSGYSSLVSHGYKTWAELSGLRLLVSSRSPSSTTDRDLVLTDLRADEGAGLVTNWGADPTQRPALWGDLLVFAKPDGSVWMVDLGTIDREPQQVAAAPAAGATNIHADLFAGPGHIGWNRTWTPTGSASSMSDSVIMDLKPGTPINRTGTQISVVPSSILGMNSDGWVDRTSDGNVGLEPWDGSPLTRDAAPWIVIDGPYKAFVSAGRPYVQLLSRSIPIRPQSLGNTVAAPELSRGKTWTLADVTSAVIHTCSVTITTPGGKAVRTLGCQSLWQQGEVRATWDGRSSKGTYVPAGQIYVWTIHAGNSTGSELDEHGTTKPPSGEILVN